MRWIRVYIAPDRIVASLIKGMLNAVGIEVRLQGESLGELINAGPLAEIRVLVPEEDAAEAERLLAAQETNGDGSEL